MGFYYPGLCDDNDEKSALLYEIICTKPEIGGDAREASLGFIDKSELDAAKAYCRHRNTLSMYNNVSPYEPYDFRVRPAFHPKLQFEDSVVFVEVFDDGRVSLSKTVPRSQWIREHGVGVNALVLDHSYVEILPVIDGETKEQWAARFEGVHARGKAILGIKKKVDCQ